MIFQEQSLTIMVREDLTNQSLTFWNQPKSTSNDFGWISISTICLLDYCILI